VVKKMTGRFEIADWFDKGVADKQRYMLVYCDTFDYGDYPVYAKSAEEFWRIFHNSQYSMDNMQRLVEVYDLSMGREWQLDERHAWHLPPAEEL
jgi:hypothetical protein